MVRKALRWALLILLLSVLYLLFWPVPIDPQAWRPPPSQELSAMYAPNHKLALVERLELPSGHGPEDVAVDEMGRVYGGLQDGRIVRFSPGQGSWETFADTQGRPLGLHFDASGHLIVADAYQGLLAIDPDGTITVLTTEAGGTPFMFTDDVDIAANGDIYFSDASSKFNQANYRADALEHRPNGRLLRYRPATGQTEVLMGGLYFANGVAVSPDQRFVLVNETWKYRVTRLWLSGEKQGLVDVFADNLPGFPDGISSQGEGLFWLALVSPRNSLVDRLAPYPFARKIIHRLPTFLQPDATPYAFVLGLDHEGRVVHNLQEPSGEPFGVITSVQQHGDWLYLGSLREAAIGKIPIPVP